MTDVPEVIVEKPAPKLPLWRKLVVVGLGLVALVVGLLLVVSQGEKAAELGTIYIAFSVAVTGIVGAFMGANASEHKSAITSAVGTLKGALAAAGIVKVPKP
jgi:uncharacterized membrane protein HdeD (DUF308 family)